MIPSSNVIDHADYPILLSTVDAFLIRDLPTIKADAITFMAAFTNSLFLISKMKRLFPNDPLLLQWELETKARVTTLTSVYSIISTL